MNRKYKLFIKTKILLSCGAIGSALFIIVFLIEGAARADYSPLRHPISSLSIGEYGWIQIANFIITGILLLFFAIGLRRTAQNAKATSFYGPLLIGLVAIGLIGAGICSTDPVYGYPQDKPLILAQYSVSGHFHDFFSIFVFVCQPWACFVFRKQFKARGQHGWVKYSEFSGIGMLLMFVFAAIGFKQVAWFVDFAGLFQRLSIAFGGIWTALFSLFLLKTKE